MFFQIKHTQLQKSVVLLLNILYQSETLEKVALSYKTIKSLAENSEWFVPAFEKFLSSGIYTNVFYLLLIRDGLGFINDSEDDEELFFRFIQNLINTCRVDDACAGKMIRFATFFSIEL